MPTEQILPDRSQRCFRALVIIENCETLLLSVIPEFSVPLSECRSSMSLSHSFVGPIASAN